MPTRLEKLRALPPSERWLLVRLMLLLPAIGAALRLFGFKRTRDFLAGRAPRRHLQNPADSAAENELAQRIARLVSIAANHGPYRATCLRQSLALCWLLRRRGMPAELSVGARKDGGEFQAHAWVEVAGRALNDPNDATASYAAFTGSPRANAAAEP